ncbi:hypothetical protein AX14_008269 [Amanita brunnescens Koide BX004]|nr:hypothetical protein AX14_008269 [Amanita brunnescens Koide BX004]
MLCTVTIVQLCLPPAPDNQQPMPNNQALRSPRGLIPTPTITHVTNVPPIQLSILPGLSYIPTAALHSPSIPSAPVPKPLHALVITQSLPDVPLLLPPPLPDEKSFCLPRRRLAPMPAIACIMAVLHTTLPATLLLPTLSSLPLGSMATLPPPSAWPVPAPAQESLLPVTQPSPPVAPIVWPLPPV